MFTRVSAVCLLAACLCTSGALLDVAQVFAWARMFEGYTKTMPAAVAAEETLDPSKPCDLCKAVQKARDACPVAPVNDHQASIQKLLLTREEPDRFIFTRELEEWSHEELNVSPAPYRAVPVPPPRADAASVIV